MWKVDLCIVIPDICKKQWFSVLHFTSYRYKSIMGRRMDLDNLLSSQGQGKFSLKISLLVFLNFMSTHWFPDAWYKYLIKACMFLSSGLRVSLCNTTQKHLMFWDVSYVYIWIIYTRYWESLKILNDFKRIFKSTLVSFPPSHGILGKEVISNVHWSSYKAMQERSELWAGVGGAGIDHWC